MKKFLTIMICGIFLCFAGSAMASPIYYEASGVTANAVVTYDYDYEVFWGVQVPVGGNDAPEFTLTGLEGDVDTNYWLFEAGNYTVDIFLTGFWIDGLVDEDGTQLTFDGSFHADDLYIPSLSLVGSYGALSWNFDPYSSLWLSYDFGDAGAVTNADVNQGLIGLDLLASGDVNGVMDNIVGWNNFRVELNSTAPVPEPATILLMGAGLLGLVGFSRKRSSKKS